MPTEETIKGQVSLFDQDSWYGKMFPEPYPQDHPKAKTSASSSKRSQKSVMKLPLYLDLRSGGGQEQSWEMGGALLGEYTMHSFGECPKEENASLLSQILVDDAPPKYSLSVKACRGILNRAEKRGKALPTELKEALERQTNEADEELHPQD